jgi:hypothetical protein
LVRNGRRDGRLRGSVLNLALFEFQLHLPQLAIALGITDRSYVLWSQRSPLFIDLPGGIQAEITLPEAPCELAPARLH